jgi:hypothetical protein
MPDHLVDGNRYRSLVSRLLGTPLLSEPMPKDFFGTIGLYRFIFYIYIYIFYNYMVQPMTFKNAENDTRRKMEN